ncbi:vancomycin high temperature exclusion protein [Paenibacillus chartarius]|uniref:Vancomycin high temperature exclusion protein n=1 Tax=Paenibacillus chartarius TaxID=747481 RepID=A0ABV6DGK8_9BACL
MERQIAGPASSGGKGLKEDARSRRFLRPGRKLAMRLVTIMIIAALAAVGCGWAIHEHVVREGSAYIVEAAEAPQADAILVLGAKVTPGGGVSAILGDRLQVGLQLYQAGKSNRILVSGDHGRTTYDEVNTMKSFLKARGVPGDHIFMDHAGFSTYESMYRARDIFQVKKVLIVTQRYHLMRAVYEARQLGLDAYGVASDLQRYAGMPRFELREVLARIKDFFWVNVWKPKPTYLGETIPVSGSGALTDDKQ